MNATRSKLDAAKAAALALVYAFPEHDREKEPAKTAHGLALIAFNALAMIVATTEEV